MTETERAFAEQLAALAPVTRRWVAVLHEMAQTMARACARLSGYPIRKGRIVTRAHTRTHWGHHG